jgi:hypothetical protein
MTKREQRLLDLCARALKLLERMEADGGARLPYPDYQETKEALKAVIDA